MTIQEYKNTLQCWLTTFADCGVTTDAIYGAQLMFNYAQAWIIRWKIHKKMIDKQSKKRL